MKNKIHLYFALVFMLVSGIKLKGQKYFVSFADKNNNTYSLESPSEFLSQRAIARRVKQDIAFIPQDLPVSQAYADSVKRMGIAVLWASKWLNGVIVESSKHTLMDTLVKVSFVKDVQLIWKETARKAVAKFNKVEEGIGNLKSSAEYGVAWMQSKTVNGHYLHQNNYEGQNKVIAVLDNGFNSANTLSSFAHLWQDERILSVRDVVNPGADVFASGEHGTQVFSIMGGLLDSQLKGSAPKAAYHLIRTEDNGSECPIEEYNWVVGAEYADSIGADIINSSLGYNYFDGDFLSYSNAAMDGKTTVVTRGAQIAFSKGMFVVCSAGNEGAKSWEKITAPADANNVLAVAAMDADSIRAPFSSYGPSADYRVKPDIAAMGKGTALQNTSGNLALGDGTSFSAPVISGFVACLWQAFPQLKNTELLHVMRQCAHNYSNPDYAFGYGIPDFKKALDVSNSIERYQNSNFITYPNPFGASFTISSSADRRVNKISMYDMAGHIVYQQKISDLPVQVKGLHDLPKGLYLLKIELQKSTRTFKIVKN
ncbi:Por secretion system C-terminal sorting domain-containing protein [Saccharicrinis carchari]|uniref:Por secretion system C-terminal sorting domain-containing protein n=1 Tax=Saccharicrinis carchari TaxID=1168039 RepID=A0A521DD00_SACCC|nr:S8 family serine peptidase [Saccharicrinis carchari]SMO69485.1 Por secretion system C-terminal sorting domain-containing protein [Saccharicrinis carchari]